MFTVYILFSEISQKYYTGQTQDVENRIIEHNSGETKSIKKWNSLGNGLELPSRSKSRIYGFGKENKKHGSKKIYNC